MKRQPVRFELRHESIRVLTDRQLTIPVGGGAADVFVQTKAVQNCTPT
jgi:hypothetical protein